MHLLLRAAALPGADWVLPVLTSRGLRGVGRGKSVLRRTPLAPTAISSSRARFASLANTGSRQAFLHTVRSVIEPSGQRVSATDRLHLAAPMLRR